MSLFLLRGYIASCVTSLAFDSSPVVGCCVLGNDVFHKFLVGLSIYFSDLFHDGLKLCSVLGLIGCFCMSPGSVFVPRLSFQFVVDPGFMMFG